MTEKQYLVTFDVFVTANSEDTAINVARKCVKQHMEGSVNVSLEEQEQPRLKYPEDFEDGTNCHGDEDECLKCINKCPDQIEKEKGVKA